VILVGSFNPAIFQPSWFARQGLIPDEEADSATINIIHQQVASFETPAFKVQVLPERFEVTAVGRPFTDLVRDLAYGTFTILSHTPVRMLGMNNFAHFRARSEEAWHGLGHYLAPKEFWEPLLKNPGMQTLTIRGQRDDDLLGYVDVRVEPSAVVTPNGVFAFVNDHVQLKEEERDGARILMETLQEKWGKATGRAGRIITTIRAKVE